MRLPKDWCPCSAGSNHLKWETGAETRMSATLHFWASVSLRGRSAGGDHTRSTWLSSPLVLGILVPRHRARGERAGNARSGDSACVRSGGKGTRRCVEVSVCCVDLAAGAVHSFKVATGVGIYYTWIRYVSPRCNGKSQVTIVATSSTSA